VLTGITGRNGCGGGGEMGGGGGACVCMRQPRSSIFIWIWACLADDKKLPTKTNFFIN
jgi:hypothetical protein